MDKKFFLFGMAAILGASLVFFGCDQGDSSGDETPSGSVEITGTKKGADVTKAIEDALAKDSNAEIVFKDLTISEGTADLKAAKVTIKGTLKLAENVIIDASKATVAFADSNAKIEGDASNTIKGDDKVFTKERVGDINVDTSGTEGSGEDAKKAAEKLADDLGGSDYATVKDATVTLIKNVTL
jgi:hypothetical protein